MKPSDHLRAGECPFCHGSGRRPELTIQVAEPDLADRLDLCPACHGTGKPPP